MPRAEEILRAQREAFRKKFWRDWQSGDPVFFDPDADEPTRMSIVKAQAECSRRCARLECPRRSFMPTRKQASWRLVT